MYQLRKKKLAHSVAIYGQGRELLRPPTYVVPVTNTGCVLCNWAISVSHTVSSLSDSCLSILEGILLLLTLSLWLF